MGATPVRSASSPIDRNVGATDESWRSVWTGGIDFERTRSRLLVPWNGAASGPQRRPAVPPPDRTGRARRRLGHGSALVERAAQPVGGEAPRRAADRPRDGARLRAGRRHRRSRQPGSSGLVVGVDHSEVMLRQARRRNAAAIGAGRVRLIHAPVEYLQHADGPFDAALAVNTVGFWSEPTVRLRRTRPGAAPRRSDRSGVAAPLPGCYRDDVGCGRRRAGRHACEAGFEDLRCRDARPRPAGGVRPRVVAG